MPLEINKIYCADCLTLMQEIPDKSIDLVLTDPPYGIERFKRGSLRFDKTNEFPNGILWDEKPTQKYFDEMFRISKYQIIWGANNFILPPTEYFIIWDKHQTVDNFASAEYAWTSVPHPAKVFHYSIHKHNQTEKFHPTQKPLKLMEWCLKNYSKEGDLVLDPFLGSGTTAIACKRLNRNFIGIEKEPKYVEIALKRLEKVNNHRIDEWF